MLVLYGDQFLMRTRPLEKRGLAIRKPMGLKTLRSHPLPSIVQTMRSHSVSCNVQCVYCIPYFLCFDTLHILLSQTKIFPVCLLIIAILLYVHSDFTS